MNNQSSWLTNLYKFFCCPDLSDLKISADFTNFSNNFSGDILCRHFPKQLFSRQKYDWKQVYRISLDISKFFMLLVWVSIFVHYGGKMNNQCSWLTNLYKFFCCPDLSDLKISADFTNFSNNFSGDILCRHFPKQLFSRQKYDWKQVYRISLDISKFFMLPLWVSIFVH